MSEESRSNTPPARTAGDDGDLDARIAAAERAVIERDASVRLSVHALLDAGRRKAGVGLAIGIAIVAVGGLLLLKFLLSRGDREPARRSASPTVMPYVLGLLGPLVARALRPDGARSPRGGEDPLLGLILPSLGFLFNRRAPADAPVQVGTATADNPQPPIPAISAPPSPPVRAAQQVDLKRYLGHWYEIARLPMRYERHCVSDVSATYTLHPTRGLVAVHNCCREANGRLRSARGVAHVVKGSANARLKVSFAPALLRPLPIVWSDYWILEVDADYRYALVGTPDRRCLWFLSRTPTLADADCARLIEHARQQGYATSKLIFSPQQDAEELTYAPLL